MSPIVTIMALTLCAGLIALVRALRLAPEGIEHESGFTFERVPVKTVRTAPAATLLGAAPAPVHRRIRAA